MPAFNKIFLSSLRLNPLATETVASFLTMHDLENNLVNILMLQ